MTEGSWEAVDRYFEGALGVGDSVLDSALKAGADAGLAPHDVSPLQGKLLHLLARAVSARRILEIGTLAGYSAIWLARALPPDGRLVTLEVDPRAADVARRNLQRAGLSDRTEVLVGPADETLPALTGPFDLIFVDADKRSNAAYLRHALTLSRPGTLIVADNVVRDGAVADARSEDPSVQGVRAFAEALGKDPRVDATAIQTVGTKGHDGFVAALVTSN